jgi:hypothetical protein
VPPQLGRAGDVTAVQLKLVQQVSEHPGERDLRLPQPRYGPRGIVGRLEDLVHELGQDPGQNAQVALGEPGQQRGIEPIDGIDDRGPDQLVGTGAQDHGPVRLGQRRHVGGGLRHGPVAREPGRRVGHRVQHPGKPPAGFLERLTRRRPLVVRDGHEGHAATQQRRWHPVNR